MDQANIPLQLLRAPFQENGRIVFVAAGDRCANWLVAIANQLEVGDQLRAEIIPENEPRVRLTLYLRSRQFVEATFFNRIRVSYPVLDIRSWVIHKTNLDRKNPKFMVLYFSTSQQSYNQLREQYNMDIFFGLSGKVKVMVAGARNNSNNDTHRTFEYR